MYFKFNRNNCVEGGELDSPNTFFNIEGEGTFFNLSTLSPEEVDYTLSYEGVKVLKEKAEWGEDIWGVDLDWVITSPNGYAKITLNDSGEVREVRWEGGKITDLNGEVAWLLKDPRGFYSVMEVLSEGEKGLFDEYKRLKQIYLLAEDEDFKFHVHKKMMMLLDEGV